MLVLATGLLGLFLTLLPRLSRLGEKAGSLQSESPGTERTGLAPKDTISSPDSQQHEKLSGIHRQTSSKINDKHKGADKMYTRQLVPHFSERISTDSAFLPDQPVPMAGLDTIPAMWPLPPIR